MITRLFLSFLLMAGALHAQTSFSALTSLENALNSIKTLEAGFTQKNSDGSTFKGKVFLSRPGKIKFDYEDPKGMVIISDGENLIYFDPDAHQATYLSLEDSPASLLLDEVLNFEKHATVMSIDESKDLITVYLKTLKTKHEVTLFIDAKDKMLKGWKTVDLQGNESILSFSDIKKNGTFCDPELFVFKRPKRRKKNA